MQPMETPIAIRHRNGAEWMRHMAGRALLEREAATARAAQEASWRLLEAFIPCG